MRIAGGGRPGKGASRPFSGAAGARDSNRFVYPSLSSPDPVLLQAGHSRHGRSLGMPYPTSGRQKPIGSKNPPSQI